MDRLPVVGSNQTPTLAVSGKGQLISGGSYLRSKSLTSGMGVDPKELLPQQLSALSSSASAATLSHTLNSADKLESSNSSSESAGVSPHLVGSKPNPFNKTFPLETLPNSKQQLSSLQHSSAATSSRGKGVTQDEEGTVTPTIKSRKKIENISGSGMKTLEGASGAGSSEKKSSKRGSKGKVEPVGAAGAGLGMSLSAGTMTSADDAQIVLTPLKQKQQMTTDSIAAQFSSSLPNPSVLASASFNDTSFFPSSAATSGTSGGSGSCSAIPPPPLVSSTSVTPMVNKHKTLVPNSSSSTNSNTRKLSPVVSSIVVDGGDGPLLESATAEKKAKKVVKRKSSNGAIIMNSGTSSGSSVSSKRNPDTMAPISHATATGGTAAGPVVITPIEVPVRRRKKPAAQTTTDAGTNAGGNASDDTPGRSRGNSVSSNSGYSSANDSGGAGVDGTVAVDGPVVSPGNGPLRVPVGGGASSTSDERRFVVGGAEKNSLVDGNSKKHRLLHNDMLIRDKLQQGLAMNQKQSTRGGNSTLGIAVSGGGSSSSENSGSGSGTPFAAVGTSATKNPFAGSGSSNGNGNNSGNGAASLGANPPTKAMNTTGANPGATMHKFSLWNKKAKLPASVPAPAPVPQMAPEVAAVSSANHSGSSSSANPLAANPTSNPFGNSGGASFSNMSTPLGSITASPTGQGGNFFGSSGGKMAARLRGITADGADQITGGDGTLGMPVLATSNEPVNSGSLANSLRQMIDSAGPTSVSSSKEQLRRSQEIPEEDYTLNFCEEPGKSDIDEVTEDIDALVVELLDRTHKSSRGDSEEAETAGVGSGSGSAVSSANATERPAQIIRTASNMSARSTTSNRSHLTIEEEEELKTHHTAMLNRLSVDRSDSDVGSGDVTPDEVGGIDMFDTDAGDDGDDHQLLANRMSSSRTVSPVLSEMSQSIDDPSLYPPSPNSTHQSPAGTFYGAEHPAIAVTKVNMNKKFANCSLDHSYGSYDEPVDDAEIVVPVSQIKTSPKCKNQKDPNSFRSTGSAGSAGSSYKSTNTRRNGSSGSTSIKAGAATMLATLGQPDVHQNAATIRTNKNNFGRPGSGNAESSSSGAADDKPKPVPGAGALQLKWKKGRQIGEGSFGRVFQGMNTVTGESLAIKQLVLVDGSGEEVKRLQKEIDVMEDLSHPNIVRYNGNCFA